MRLNNLSRPKSPTSETAAALPSSFSLMAKKLTSMLSSLGCMQPDPASSSNAKIMIVGSEPSQMNQTCMTRKHA
ncbi:hypothetical protein EG68_01739 [Paragonimus skrjabini miyazakii]|uniref:Uncharacterized protein n=1 Tax=Paragonimus skrjabini miyazakii TaxID=59628 RepID=A0A8S9Z5Z6_9TREM|nr:hypothetical protein EG68_01739 [Paragonimus skrjabini miyazakii]